MSLWGPCNNWKSTLLSLPKAKYQDYCFRSRSLLKVMVSCVLANRGNVPINYWNTWNLNKLIYCYYYNWMTFRLLHQRPEWISGLNGPSAPRGLCPMNLTVQAITSCRHTSVFTQFKLKVSFLLFNTAEFYNFSFLKYSNIYYSNT